MPSTDPRDWARFADSDYRMMLLAREAMLQEQIFFHAHQAVEKLCKALLVAHGRQPRFTRDLSALVSVLISFYPEAGALLAACDRLTSEYISARYPTGSQMIQPAKVEQALADVDAVRAVLTPLLEKFL
jgi:HEPN domain-containing protein